MDFLNDLFDEEEITCKRKNTCDDDEIRKKLKQNELQKQRLENIVFGDGSDVLEHIERIMKRHENAESSDSGYDDVSKSPVASSTDLSLPHSENQPAWIDDENIEIENQSGIKKSLKNYQEFLRKKFKSIYGEPSWAQLKTRKEEDENDLLKRCGNFIKKSSKLSKTVINIKVVRHLNRQTRNEGPVIKSIEFHPDNEVALIAGTSGVVSVVQVDGENNSKLASVHFERYPISKAKFSKNGNDIIVGSALHNHFFVYDLAEGKSKKVHLKRTFTDNTNLKNFEVSPNGKLLAVTSRFGYIHLLTTGSFENIHSFKMSNSVYCIAFNYDGSLLYSFGEGGDVYIWDMVTRKLLTKFYDEGCLDGCSLALSKSDQFLALGSSSGVVNLYENSDVVKKGVTSNFYPKPVKSIMNLTTSVTSLAFDSSDQILAMSSNQKMNAVKLFHTPSLTVFNNFPTLNTTIGKINCLNFSPNSGYLSLGTAAGNKGNSTAWLYRLQHFGNY